MDDIQYKRLDTTNFNGRSLDSFVRHQGIGRRLFSIVCEEALRLGADKLYISGHSSKESQAAYRALGCTFAEEVNESLAEAEPFDVQLEYRLRK